MSLRKAGPVVKHRLVPVVLGICVISAAMIAGCSKTEGPPSSSGLPVVPVSHPVERDVTDYVDFTGRTDAVKSVGVRARVTGYLVKNPFREGSEVKKGDLLFEIDPRPYQAQLDQAQAQVALNQASLKLAQATLERARPLLASGGVSRQEIDEDVAAVNEAEARIKASQAAVEVNKLNMEFTKVTSPIDGMVSRYYFTEGNLVNQDQTLLTTVVSLDPMYAYFDMDEPTLQRINKAINEGKIKLPEHGSDVPILMGLQVEPGYPHTGSFNFLNNVVNPATGSIAVRGLFANPKPSNGTRLLRPGMFVRIRLPIGEPHRARLIVDKALGSDQGQKFVYVLDKDNKAQYRRVRSGPLQDDGLRVIEEARFQITDSVLGTLRDAKVPQETLAKLAPLKDQEITTRAKFAQELAAVLDKEELDHVQGSLMTQALKDGVFPDDWVVVGALQQVRPRLEVQPEQIAMPTMGKNMSRSADRPQPPPPGEKGANPKS
jgi:RND family efflux transporter MFP subunit